jgi:hypothetical protein
MPTWTSDELTRIGNADELRVAFRLRRPKPDLDDELDAAYRSKYRRYAASIVDSIIARQARSATVKLVPR